LIFGAIDDLWENPQNQYIVVDYKATSKRKHIIELDEPWHDSYKRQMEVYQWLLRKNSHDVSHTGYIVYCNGNKDKEAFDGRLEFEVTVIPYTGSDAWVEPTIHEIHDCLNSPTIPETDPECDYCTYREAVAEVEESHES
jgi:CRISPR/Cas system-associated exonuclease Cas4 (RecB family)